MRFFTCSFTVETRAIGLRLVHTDVCVVFKSQGKNGETCEVLVMVV